MLKSSNLLKRTVSEIDFKWKENSSILRTKTLENDSREEMLEYQKLKTKRSSLSPSRTKANEPSFLPLLNNQTPKIIKAASKRSIADNDKADNINPTSKVLKIRLPSRENTAGSPIRSAILAKRLQSRATARDDVTNQRLKLSEIRLEGSVGESQSKIDTTRSATVKMDSQIILSDESIRKTSRTDRNLSTDRNFVKLEDFFASYQPLDCQFFESLKALSGNMLINYTMGYYYGQFTGNEHNGKGIFVSYSGKTYEGEWVDDKKSGVGIERFGDGHVYKGYFAEGKRHGQGSFRWKDGDIYEGEFFNGLKHGKGVWKSVTGSSYSGDWVEGKAEGFGIHIWENGDRYEGEFRNSLKEGKGTEVYSNGDKYIGEYREGKPSGYGEYCWQAGATYKGYFCNGLMDGKGSYQNSGGDKYEGNYKEGKKHGYGEFTWISGNVYKGNFNNDLREGYGEMYWTDGSCYKGEWFRGIQHGKGEMILPDQKRVNGNFNHNIFTEETPTKKSSSLPKLAKRQAPSPKVNIRARKQYSTDINNKRLDELNFSVSRAIYFAKRK